MSEAIAIHGTAQRGFDASYVVSLLRRRLPLSAVCRMSGASQRDVQIIADLMVAPTVEPQPEPEPEPAPVAYTWPEPSSPPDEGTMAACVWWAAKRHGFLCGDLRGAKTSLKLVAARHEAMWECFQIKDENGAPKFTSPAIGRYFGGRHHTTALYAVRKHEATLAGVKLDRKSLKRGGAA